jgi:hypothetical protein
MQFRSYDLPTAVTFLMAGLGIGSLLALVFSSRSPRLDLLSSRNTHRASA